MLTALEIRALVDHLALRERTLVLLAASTGLRQSELFGLKWRDVDFERNELSVTSSASLVAARRSLLRSRFLCIRYLERHCWSDDWIFASRSHKGRRPYWGVRKYVRPLAESLNIQKRIGRHTFQHTFSTRLRSVGAVFKVMQELMRHSTLRTTMDVYTQAVAPAKHAAQATVLALFFPVPRSDDDHIIIGTA